MNGSHTGDFAWWQLPRWAPVAHRILVSVLAGGLIGALASWFMACLAVGFGYNFFHLGFGLGLGTVFGFVRGRENGGPKCSRHIPPPPSCPSWRTPETEGYYALSEPFINSGMRHCKTNWPRKSATQIPRHPPRPVAPPNSFQDQRSSWLADGVLQLRHGPWPGSPSDPPVRANWSTGSGAPSPNGTDPTLTQTLAGGPASPPPQPPALPHRVLPRRPPPPHLGSLPPLAHLATPPLPLHSLDHHRPQAARTVPQHSSPSPPADRRVGL